MQLKKIMYISVASNISGATLALLEIIEEVKKQGIEPVVITAERGELEKRLQERGVRFYKARYASWLCRDGELDTITGKIKFVVKKLLEMYSEQKISAALKKESPEILHINTGMSPVGMKSALKYGIPVVWHLREIPEICWNRHPYDPKYEKKCFQSADALIAISDYVKHVFQKKSQQNLVRIYDGVDVSEYETIRTQRPLSSSTIKLSLCGGQEQKGHAEAIRALKILVDKGIKNLELSFWGEFIPEYKIRMKALVQELQVEKWVNFCGNTDIMSQKWKETDIALVCSTGEAFGRVTVEAMAAGAIVIGADAGATPELLKENGLLYKQGNSEDLAEKICWSIEHGEEACLMAERGQKYVLDGAYSLEKNIDALLSLYVRILKKRRTTK